MERVLPPNNSKKPRNTAVKKEHSLFDDEFPIADSASLNVDDETTHRRPTATKPAKNPLSRWVKVLLGFILFAFLTLAAFIGFAAYTYWTSVYPTLPNVAELKNIQMQVPLRVYTSDMKLIAEYGEKKRIPLSYEQFPPQMVQAILASEDDRFFEHPGVDYQGLLRAALELAKTGSKSQGGSTITMQVARNFFLTPEKSFMRKINEIVLSLNIESELTKEEILALYMNKIFLGQRSYGFAAAAQSYFGRPIDQLTVDEYALLAGLPKAPSTLNPVANPEAAKNRRDYVLRRMTELGYITEVQRSEAQAKPVESKLYTAQVEVHAEHLAEMARLWAVERYGDGVLEQGLKIITTVNSELEKQAQSAVNTGVLAYERRHGYRGPVASFDANQQVQWPLSAKELMEPDVIKLALVTDWNDKTKSAQVKLKDGTQISLDAKASEWARNFKAPNRKSYLQVGDVIFVEPLADKTYRLAQAPRIQSALVSIDSKTGALLAISGGFDEARNHFNRATQARRQPGSSFKPFLYAAAIDKGYTPATIINDAPISQYDEYSEDYWRPENYTKKFGGPTRMRVALVHSLNLVSIRIMQDIGVDYFMEFAQRIGMDTKEMSTIRNLSIALGTSSTSVLEHTGHYAMFANGGYQLKPYFVQQVLDAKDQPIFNAEPPKFCEIDCPEETAARVISPETQFLTTSMMQDVVRMGTAHGAMVLKRNDLAGKTGTTNDIKDTWFVGFNPDIVTGVWMGFDQPISMGKQESGGSSALPIWIDFMRLALKDKPDVGYAKPDSIVVRRIDSNTGELLPDGQSGGVNEFFDQNNLPAISQPDPLRELQHELF
jgi:penicillin-binding protein 1A